MSGGVSSKSRDRAGRASAADAESVAVLQGPEDGMSVGHLMARARAAILTNLDAELEPFGLTSSQYGVLKNVADGVAETAVDLCRLMHYDNGSMTRLLDRLEDKGLLRRERGKEDRRMIHLHLTSNGRIVLPRLRALAVRVLERHLAGFTPHEIDNLKRFLGRMIENAETLKNGSSAS